MTSSGSVCSGLLRHIRYCRTGKHTISVLLMAGGLFVFLFFIGQKPLIFRKSTTSENSKNIHPGSEFSPRRRNNVWEHLEQKKDVARLKQHQSSPVSRTTSLDYSKTHSSTKLLETSTDRRKDYSNINSMSDNDDSKGKDGTQTNTAKPTKDMDDVMPYVSEGKNRNDVALPEVVKDRNDVTLTEVKDRNDITLPEVKDRNDVTLPEIKDRHDVTLPEVKDRNDVTLSEVKVRDDVTQYKYTVVQQSEDVDNENDIRIDNSYENDFNENIPHGSGLTDDTNHDQGTQVLLLTYLRSGSTLTADIIQQVPEVFYVYEPLKPYIGQGNAYFTTKGICDINTGTYRSPSTPSQEITTVINDIVKYYNCDFGNFTRTFLHSTKSNVVEEHKACLRLARDRRSRQHCLQRTRDKCLYSSKSMKTIRLGMDIVEILMEKLPHLKVIHLLRDPRGMIRSRKKGTFIKSWMNLTSVAQCVCKRFEKDIEIARKLRKMHPGKIKTYMYEQIAMNPEKASKSLFKFLGLSTPDNFFSWLHNHTNAGIKSKYYETSRPNSTLTANEWRLSTPLKEVMTIDSVCRKFYKYTGITEVNNESVLKNIDIPLRVTNTEFGDYL